MTAPPRLLASAASVPLTALDWSMIALYFAILAGVTVTAEDRRQSRGSWDLRETAASGVVFLCILGAYLYVRG